MYLFWFLVAVKVDCCSQKLILQLMSACIICTSLCVQKLHIEINGALGKFVSCFNIKEAFSLFSRLWWVKIREHFSYSENFLYGLFEST